MCLRCSVWACGSLINPQSFCLYLMHAVWKKYLERHSIIYASRYLNKAIAYKLHNVFQYSVSLQYNCFDTIFTTMYFNTAQLCLWPMTFFGLAGRKCPLLVHATSGLPFIPSFTSPLPLYILVVGCNQGEGEDKILSLILGVWLQGLYQSCSTRFRVIMYIIMYHITVIRPLVLLMVPQIALM